MCSSLSVVCCPLVAASCVDGCCLFYYCMFVKGSLLVVRCLFCVDCCTLYAVGWCAFVVGC